MGVAGCEFDAKAESLRRDQSYQIQVYRSPMSKAGCPVVKAEVAYTPSRPLDHTLSVPEFASAEVAHT